MYFLIVFIYLVSGQVQPRVSIAYSEHACTEAVPYYKKLYLAGKFDDGPRPELIKQVKARCEPVEEDNKVAGVESLTPSGPLCTGNKDGTVTCQAPMRYSDPMPMISR